MTTASPRLMLLDTAAMYFRAFYGVPDTVRAPNGMPVNAVRGLLDAIARLVTDYSPSAIVACWDDDWRPQWRVDLIPSYKAHRVAVEVPAGSDIEEVPDLLSPQVPVIREVLAALHIPVVGLADYEADDIIGSLASQATIPVDVVTGDRDLFQLIDDSRGIRVIYTGRGMSKLEVLTNDTLIGKYAVRPDQYADFAALRGDPSDGLPGIAGIGEKTAASMLAEHGSLAGIRAAASDPSIAMSATIRAKLEAATDYLDVAPRVVEVVRDLSLPEVDSAIAPLNTVDRARVEELAATWGLGESAQRILRAMGS